MIHIDRHLFNKLNQLTYFVVVKEYRRDVSPLEGGLYYKRVLKIPYAITTMSRERVGEPYTVVDIQVYEETITPTQVVIDLT
jgi:hypothetical protein